MRAAVWPGRGTTWRLPIGGTDPSPIEGVTGMARAHMNAALFLSD